MSKKDIKMGLLDPNSFLQTDMNVFWSDKDGYYLGCNDKVSKLFGVTEDKIIGRRIDDLVKDNIVQKSLADYLNNENSAVLSAQTPRLNIADPVIIHANGAPIHYVTNRFPLFDHNNKISGVFGLTVNITDSLLVKRSGLFGYLIMAAHTNRREKYLNELFTNKETDQSVSGLSLKESKCLYYVLRGKSAREIGEILFISTRTVEGHIANAKDKLQCKTRSELIDRILSDIQLLYEVQSNI